MHIFSYRTKLKTNVGMKSDRTQCKCMTNDLTNKNGKGMEETGKPESKFADCFSTIIDESKD